MIGYVIASKGATNELPGLTAGQNVQGIQFRLKF